MFRASPLGWLGVVFAYFITMLLLSLVPFVGTVVAAVLVPALSVGFMAAARAASRGEPFKPTLLFQALGPNRRPQLVLGMVYLACLAGILGVLSFMQANLTLPQPAEASATEDPLASARLAAVAAVVLLYLPVMMAFWFAPVLAAWHGVRPMKALFFSFFACLMNWRAFLAYGAVAVLVTTIVPIAVLALVILVSGKDMEMQVQGLLLPMLIVFTPVFFASFYASYRDIFGTTE